MYDYGVDLAADAMFLVLKDYRCSLRWAGRALGCVYRRSTWVLLPCLVPKLPG